MQFESESNSAVANEDLAPVCKAALDENPYAAASADGQDDASDKLQFSRSGIAAICLGLAGMTCSILSHHFFEELPQSRSSIKIDLGFVEWERTTGTPPPAPGIRNLVKPFHARLVAISLGTAAVAMSIVSWFRGEGFWLGLGGCVLAAAAVAWIWFVCAFAIMLMSGGLFTFLPDRFLAKQESE